MKRSFLLITIFSLIGLWAGECEDLIKKYHAPDPTIKTMKQIKRWIKRKKSKLGADADKLQQCMIARAADNPNKAEVAGE